MTPRTLGRGTGATRRVALLAAALLALSSLVLVTTPRAAAAVAVTVPYSPTAVADADLDGNPTTGSWSDAMSAVIPLENGDTTGYGSATLRAKHDGTYFYLRIDGQIDVPWTGPTGNRFWLGMQISPTSTAHHSGGTWDGTFFGLWDGTDYSPQPSYPPSPVDTNGFTRPPAKDASQDDLGKMRYSGSAAPYNFTAEWKKKLSTGDASDIAYAADGTTPYNFFVTTDSNGGGSSGGAIDHNRVTNLNTLRFAAPASANTPPQANLSAPDGGQVWSGGTSHAIWWNMSDAETATTALRVWINYSTDGGLTYGPISGAQGLSGFTNPCSYAWTVPLVTTTQARVRVTVADPQGATASDASLANFAIDSTRPAVTAFNPADGATGVSPATQVRVSFSEAMNRPSVEQAFSLRRVDTGSYVTGSFAWAGTDLTFTPSSALSQGVVYRTQVNGTAMDASSPGNALGTVRTANFTTADVVPPTISAVSASPSPQEAGGIVNVSAAVTDNGVVTGVWIDIRDPGGTLPGNATAGFDVGTGRYFRAGSYTLPGTYTFRISARDAAGNWGVSTGSFVIVDTRPPTIQHTPATEAVRGVSFRIFAIVTDAQSVANVRLDYTDVLGARFNVSMVLNGTGYEYDVPGQPQLGSLTYFIWAIDPSGNAGRTSTYTVAIVGSDTVPPVISDARAAPPLQDATFSVNITANVTDNVALQSVSVAVTGPTGTLGNFTMTRLAVSDSFYKDAVYSGLGVYTFVIWAIDTSDNAASFAGSFRIVDRIAPVFQTVTVAPPTQEAGLDVNVTAVVTDNLGVSGVWAHIAAPQGAVVVDAAMAGGPNLYWIVGAFASLGTFNFTLNATDATGNFATASGSFQVVDSEPPVAVAGPDLQVWIGSSVIFNGSASHDNLGIANYSWSFVYNGTPTVLYGAVTTFRFDAVGQYSITLQVVDLADLTGAVNLTVTVIADRIAPSMPKGLAVSSVAPACLEVTWEPSPADDIAGYRLYRWNESRQAFDLIAELPANATSYTDCGLSDDAAYSYWLTAFDGSGNVSPPSTIANGRTLAEVPVEPSPTPLFEAVVVMVLVLVGIIVALQTRRGGRRDPPGGETKP